MKEQLSKNNLCSQEKIPVHYTKPLKKSSKELDFFAGIWYNEREKRRKRGSNMLKEKNQIQMSEYSDLYEIIIPKENILRKIKENIDFSFVNPMLAKSYCEYYGRPAKEPEMMFKLMFMKKQYDLSDERLIENANIQAKIIWNMLKEKKYV